MAKLKKSTGIKMQKAEKTKTLQTQNPKIIFQRASKPPKKTDLFLGPNEQDNIDFANEHNWKKVSVIDFHYKLSNEGNEYYYVCAGALVLCDGRIMEFDRAEIDLLFSNWYIPILD